MTCVIRKSLLLSSSLIIYNNNDDLFLTYNLARLANLPTGLYILPSVISSFFYYEQSHLSIYWTDFHDLFTKWKAFA